MNRARFAARLGRIAAFGVLELGVLFAGEPNAAGQESQLASLRAAANGPGADPATSLALGRALRRAGHPAEALRELRRGVLAAGASRDLAVALRWELARARFDEHDFAQAMQACKALGALPGAVAEGLACAADAHLVWQRATEALTQTAAALAKDPSCYEAKLAEGRARDLTLDVAASEDAFRTAVAWQPERPEAHFWLGRLLLHDGDGRKSDAVAELRAAVRLDPSSPEALYELAEAVSPGDESVGLLERATRERPSFTEAWLALAPQELAGGRVANAKRSAEEALRHDPGKVEPHLLLGRIALAEGRSDDAIEQGAAVLKILPSSAAAKLLIADANAKKGEIDRALEAYQAAWGLDHRDPTPLVRASAACHSAGRDTSARAFAVRATEEFPRWAPAWLALGDALAAQNEREAAREAYRKALSAEGAIDRAALNRKLGVTP
ncbi:MAG: tetratricopeptide repeat protein [Myxococcota bacterium]|nr:tetratricopeptide repeat protein [Myxococcota bacterium]